MRVCTVGHGSRAVRELVELLESHGVAALCDVRAWPGSRRWPQFHREALAAALAEAGIAYRWLGKELGGFRGQTRDDSPHVALPPGMWRSYADHMESALFADGIARLLELARGKGVACLCAETDWRRCHRRHVADHLVALERIDVVHLEGAGEPRPHVLDPRARVAGHRLVYDVGAQPELF